MGSCKRLRDLWDLRGLEGCPGSQGYKVSAWQLWGKEELAGGDHEVQ